MKHSHFLMAVFCTLFLGACASSAIDGSDRQPVASVLHLSADTATYYISDFFPALAQVDSMDCDGIYMNYDATTLTFAAAASQPGIYPVTVWADGVARTLVAAYVTNASEAPVLYTQCACADTLRIGFTEQPQQVIALWNNIMLDPTCINIDSTQIKLPLPVIENAPQRSFLRVYAFANGRLFSDIMLPLEAGKVLTSAQQITRHDKHAQILYSLMIDRFHNGNVDNDWKMNNPEVLDIVDYQGGDLKGITEKIKEGFFSDLNINTIWISPISQNPYDAWGLYLEPRTKFSGYHGYWPIYITALERRFGTPDELKELLAVAHENNINVILDYVANHMHINSPTLQAHPDWATDSITPDGRRNFELWDEYRLTTWFDSHIPSLDLEREEIYEPLTDSALYWLAEYDLDGFRHDACKHIPEVYWRTLTRKIYERFPDRQLYQIGETYGSPQLIGSYVKTGMLDAQFDFNVYHTAIDAIGREGRSMAEIARVVSESGRAYGSHHVMGNISGNHDKARFISLVGGELSFDEDHKYAGWNRKVGVGNADVAYPRLALLEAINFCIPGVPCLYQGDEYGQPGANDPDNRRMMRFDGYTSLEQQHLDKMKAMAELRRNSLPLIYGDYLPLYADQDVYAFARVYLGEWVICAFSNAEQARTITLSLPANARLQNIAPMFDNEVDVQANVVTLTLQPLQFEIIK